MARFRPFCCNRRGFPHPSPTLLFSKCIVLQAAYPRARPPSLIATIITTCWFIPRQTIQLTKTKSMGGRECWEALKPFVERAVYVNALEDGRGRRTPRSRSLRREL